MKFQLKSYVHNLHCAKLLFIVMGLVFYSGNFKGKSNCWKHITSDIFRNSHQRCSQRKGVLRNFGKFTGKHVCQSLIFDKFASLSPATLLKKRLWHTCFPVNLAKFLRTPFLQNTFRRLLLHIL